VRTYSLTKIRNTRVVEDGEQIVLDVRASFTGAGWLFFGAKTNVAG
jgi:hypothetical protein